MSQTVQKQESETSELEKSEETPSWSEIASKAWDNKLSLLYETAKIESENYKRFYRINYILLVIASLVTTIPLHLPLLLVISSELSIRIYEPDSLASMYFQTICNRAHFLIFISLAFLFFAQYTSVSILTVCLGLSYWKIKNDTML